MLSVVPIMLYISIDLYSNWTIFWHLSIICNAILVKLLFCPVRGAQLLSVPNFLLTYFGYIFSAKTFTNYFLGSCNHPNLFWDVEEYVKFQNRMKILCSWQWKASWSLYTSVTIVSLSGIFRSYGNSLEKGIMAT